MTNYLLEVKNLKTQFKKDKKIFEKMFLFHEKNVYENTYKGKSITE